MRKVKSLSLMISALMIVSLISVMAAAPVSAQVPPPANVNIVVNDDWTDDTGVKNDVGVNFTWDDNAFAKIQDAIDSASPNENILVYPGTYTPEAGGLTISVDNLTLESTDGAATTIIDATGIDDHAIRVGNTTDVTIEGFTLLVSGGGIYAQAGPCHGLTVENNIFVFAEVGTTWGVLLERQPGAVHTGVLVSGNELEKCKIGLVKTSNCTVSNNTLTEGGNIWLDETTNNATIINNTVSDANYSDEPTDPDSTALHLGTVFTGDNNLIQGNTFSGSVGNGIWIKGSAITNLTITGNDITGNAEDGILIETWADTNTIDNNNIYVNEGYGINNATETLVDATLNWWGRSDIVGIINGTDGNIDADPWLDGSYPGGSSVTTKGATGDAGSKGDKGATGSTGSTGATGSTGSTGSTGAKGDEGATGATGSTGSVGPKGDTGVQGPQGTAGEDVSSGIAVASIIIAIIALLAALYTIIIKRK